MNTKDEIRRVSACSAFPVCVLLSIAQLFWVGSNVHAQTPLSSLAAMDTEIVAKLQKRGDLSLRDVTLQEALFLLSDKWQINVVVGDDVEGSVNAVFRDAPLSVILDSLLNAKGYAYQPLGRGLIVQKLGQANDLNPMFETATVTLKYVAPEDVVSSVKQLSSPQGRIEAIPSARTILVMDFPSRIHRIRQIAQQLDQAAASSAGTSLAVGNKILVEQFRLQYVDAKSAQESLQSVLSADGKVAVIEAQNRLVVYDYAPSLRMAEALVKQIDVPPMQVRITALIYDVSLDDIERIGVNWSHAIKDGTGGLEIAADTVLSAAPTVADPSGVLTFMSLSRNLDITSVVDLMQQADDARLLADPTITVIDRTAAKIEIVREIPYQQLTETAQGGNIGTTAFRNAGVTLLVTPEIADDGTIQMDITPSFSRLAGFTEGDTSQPIIDKREAQTTVRVRDKHTFVLGGLRTREDIGDFRGIPWLKDVGFMHIGSLFRYRETSVRESELLVFIRPEIVPVDAQVTGRHESALETSKFLLDQIPHAHEVMVPACPQNGCPPNGVIIEPEISTTKTITIPMEQPSATRRLEPPQGEVELPIPPEPDSAARSLRGVRSARTPQRLVPVNQIMAYPQTSRPYFTARVPQYGKPAPVQTAPVKPVRATSVPHRGAKPVYLRPARSQQRARVNIDNAIPSRGNEASTPAKSNFLAEWFPVPSGNSSSGRPIEVPPVARKTVPVHGAAKRSASNAPKDTRSATYWFNKMLKL